MFTGIVERMALVSRIQSGEGGKRLILRVLEDKNIPAWKSVSMGESISVSGVCLTVVEIGERSSKNLGGAEIGFDVVPETLSRTSLGSLAVEAAVNIERSLAVGDLFGGHYVTGHIDGTGKIIERSSQGDQDLFRIEASSQLLNEMLDKGSVTVDGVSLTIVKVSRSERWFSFAAIPHTLEITTLGRRTQGDILNLETDAFGKWVLHGLRDRLP